MPVRAASESHTGLARPGSLAGIAIVLVALTLGVYARVVQFDFLNYDDPGYITRNPYVQAGFTLRGVLWAFTTDAASGYWHPVTWLSHMLDCALYGARPGPHHATSVLLHAANAVALLLVLVRSTGALWKSAFVAALFALHPLHVESVAWISERKDVLSTFFCLLAIGAYIGHVRRPAPRRYLLALLFFALGLMAKPMVVTLPLVLLLLDAWPLGRGPFAESMGPRQGPADAIAADRLSRGLKRPQARAGTVTLAVLVREKIPFFALAAVLSVVTFAVQRNTGTVATTEHLPVSMRIANAVVSYAAYLGDMVYPARLAVIYPHPGMQPGWKILVAGLLLAAVSSWVAMLARRHRYLAVGWIWYVATLIPVIGLVQAGTQARADRYTYVPLIGIFLMIGWGVPALFPIRRHRLLVLGAAGAGAVLLAAGCTYNQVGYWRNSMTLFRRALDVTERNVVAHNNLAIALDAQGRREEALAEFEAALRIGPDQVETLNNLGVALATSGRLDEAIARYAQAVKLNPRYTEARSNLGNALLQAGKSGDAVTQLREVARLDPGRARAHVDVGRALVAGAQAAEGVRELTEALRIDPVSIPAMSVLSRVLAAHPDEKIRRGVEAVRLSERLCDLTGRREPVALETLGMAYAETGRFAEAESSARLALNLASSGGQSALAGKLQEEITMYAAQRPWREPLGPQAGAMMIETLK